MARNGFCGWLCPFGFIQDMVSSFSHFVQKRVPAVRKAVKTLKTRGARLAVLDRYLRFLKYGVLAWAVIGAARLRLHGVPGLSIPGRRSGACWS